MYTNLKLVCIYFVVEKNTLKKSYNVNEIMWYIYAPFGIDRIDRGYWILLKYRIWKLIRKKKIEF